MGIGCVRDEVPLPEMCCVGSLAAPPSFTLRRPVDIVAWIGQTANMPSTAQKRRSDDGKRTDEPLPTLTNSSSRITEGDPASGLRLREVVGPPGDPYLVGPYSDEPDMEDEFHVEQNVTIRDMLKGEWASRQDVFIGFNMSVYYTGNLTTPRSELRKVVFRGPDVFICLGARHLRFRNSWVVANEAGKYPDVIFETLSTSTKKNDRGKKKKIYEQIFKTHEYFMVDPEHHGFEAFRLVNGVYAPIAPDPTGRYWSERLGLFVQPVADPSGQASFARLFRPDGTMVPTGHEKAAQVEEKVVLERQARQQADAMAAQAAKHAAHERASRQRAEVKALRAENAAQRAEAERQCAEAERQRVAAELQHASAELQHASAEVQRLEAEHRREREIRERLEEQLRKLGLDPSSSKQ